jgi:uncharacterized repeat protein (TIGR01451 family)
MPDALDVGTSPIHFTYKDKEERKMRKIRNRLNILYKRQVRMVSRLAMLTAALLILFFGSSKLATISWANGTMVLIDPASQDVVLGGTVTTDVRVENVTDLYGFELELTFDPTLVEVVDAISWKPGVQIQPSGFLSPDWILSNTADNTNGTISFALSQMAPSLPQSGSGVLATITWRGKDAGTSPIHFSYLQLGAPSGVPIPATTQDGQITVGEVDLELSKAVDNDSPTEGEQVVFTITVSNNGSLDATGVKVKDIQWPDNMSWASDDSGGTYDKDTRIWDVGNLDMGDSATLHITATVDAEGYFENVAEVYACDQPDKDSTPNNYPPNIEDDTGVVTGDAGPTAITLSSFTARSSVGMEASFVWPWLVGVAALAVGGVLWVRRRR